MFFLPRYSLGVVQQNWHNEAGRVQEIDGDRNLGIPPEPGAKSPHALLSQMQETVPSAKNENTPNEQIPPGEYVLQQLQNY